MKYLGIVSTKEGGKTERKWASGKKRKIVLGKDGRDITLAIKLKAVT